MTHPSFDILDLYRLEELSGTQLITVSNHLVWCERCRYTVLRAPQLALLVENIEAREAIAEYTEAALAANADAGPSR